ncbi:MAG: acyl-CoA dehydrogenase family protein [Geminicoccaceae bacterium]|nr:acyl-CoA dehydrogenase family protein [Geminicoccaceae bacterium]
MDLDADYPEIREAVARICAEFPSTYWRELDAQGAYPTGFVQALSKSGYLGALIPEEHGGAGLPLRAAAVILETIRACDEPRVHDRGGLGLELIEVGVETHVHDPGEVPRGGIQVLHSLDDEPLHGARMVAALTPRIVKVLCALGLEDVRARLRDVRAVVSRRRPDRASACWP